MQVSHITYEQEIQKDPDFQTFVSAIDQNQQQLYAAIDSIDTGGQGADGSDDTENQTPSLPTL